MLLSRSAWCFDIRTSDSLYSSCFTKSYSRYVKGTGSVLLFQRGKLASDSSCSLEDLDFNDAATEIEQSVKCPRLSPSTTTPITTREFDAQWWRAYMATPLTSQSSLTATTASNCVSYMRYFTPRELLNIFGFPSDYSFPEQISLKKRYELIGNSVNVTVVRHLLNRLFAKR
jgi:site-specific DNA-cytosine methylase